MAMDVGPKSVGFLAKWDMYKGLRMLKRPAGYVIRKELNI
jgi:hypothetical protein